MKMRRHSKRQAARWKGCPSYLHVSEFWRPMAQAQWHIARGIVNRLLYGQDRMPMKNPRAKLVNIFENAIGGQTSKAWK